MHNVIQHRLDARVARGDGHLDIELPEGKTPEASGAAPHCYLRSLGYDARRDGVVARRLTVPVAREARTSRDRAAQA